MDPNLSQISAAVYKKCALNISKFKLHPESKEYAACEFDLNGLKIISRNAKITPTKSGQFVTFWKRINKGPIQPFADTDPINFYCISVRTENNFGQFVFPKSILIKKGILSTEGKDGKRGFRVYPIWDKVSNKQAEQTQNWQLNYFYEINEATKLDGVKELFHNK